jgi:hypothetical protein
VSAGLPESQDPSSQPARAPAAQRTESDALHAKRTAGAACKDAEDFIELHCVREPDTKRLVLQNVSADTEASLCGLSNRLMGARNLPDITTSMSRRVQNNLQLLYEMAHKLRILGALRR